MHVTFMLIYCEFFFSPKEILLFCLAFSPVLLNIKSSTLASQLQQLKIKTYRKVTELAGAVTKMWLDFLLWLCFMSP